MTVKIINKSNHPLPSYETIASAGMDIRAYITQPVIIKPMQRAIIKNWIIYRITIRHRSSGKTQKRSCYKKRCHGTK